MISDIMANHKDTPNVAIQMLFQLLATQPEENHPTIHYGLLLLMENKHEWGNVIKYATKWKAT